MGETATPIHHEATKEVGALTDGFHLVIDALKLNDITTIYNVPGIPITDLGRSMQAAGMRVLSFRHEQNAGYAAAMESWIDVKKFPEWVRADLISLMIEQPDGSTIYVKSNAITSVAMTGVPGNKDVVVYTKANVTKVDSSGNSTSIDSAVTLRMDAHDGSSGSGDTIGFTVLSSTNSTLYYSNDWFFDSATNTWKTRSQSTTGLTIN